MVAAGLVSLTYPAHTALAQCTSGQTSGNLSGYATTENIGRIYMSTESWNTYETPNTSTSFSVTYDQQTNTWDGRGWNEYVGWVDFNIREAELSGPRDNPTAWGNWYHVVDMSEVTYILDPGEFQGIGTNAEYTSNNGGSSTDDPVGAGDVSFTNVQLDNEPDPGCDEYVDILLNGVNILYKETCNISSPTISWTTTDVSNCVTDGGLWQNPGTRGTSGSQTASGSITEANTPVRFKLKCIGNQSGSEVTGIAFASCGPINDDDDDDDGDGNPIDPTSGVVIPDFKEV